MKSNSNASSNNIAICIKSSMTEKEEYFEFPTNQLKTVKEYFKENGLRTKSEEKIQVVATQGFFDFSHFISQDGYLELAKLDELNHVAEIFQYYQFQSLIDIYFFVASVNLPIGDEILYQFDIVKNTQSKWNHLRKDKYYKQLVKWYKMNVDDPYIYFSHEKNEVTTITAAEANQLSSKYEKDILAKFYSFLFLI